LETIDSLLRLTAALFAGLFIRCLAASEFFLETLICTALVILVNWFIEPIDSWLRNRK